MRISAGSVAAGASSKINLLEPAALWGAGRELGERGGLTTRRSGPHPYFSFRRRFPVFRLRLVGTLPPTRKRKRQSWQTRSMEEIAQILG